MRIRKTLKRRWPHPGSGRPRRRLHPLLLLVVVLGLAGLAPLATPGATPEASADTNGYYVQGVYIVPAGAPRSDRAWVVDTAMKQLQAQWANFGLTFRLADTRTVYSGRSCGDYQNDPLGAARQDLNSQGNGNVHFVMLSECLDLGGGVNSGNTSFCFNLEGMERTISFAGDTGCLGHELGHGFSVWHENCGGVEPSNAEGLRSIGLPDYATNSIMCNGGTPLGTYEDPSLTYIKDRMLYYQYPGGLAQGCNWFYECSGGSLPRLADTFLTNEAQPIRNANGDCLDVPGGNRAIETRMTIWDCVDGEGNQMFRLIPARTNVSRSGNVGGLDFTLDGVNIRSVRSGWCMDIDSFSMNPGAALTAYTCGYRDNNKFYVEGNTIRVKHSGLCLAATGTSNGSRVVQATCDGSPGQTWYVNGGGPGPDPDPDPDPGQGVQVFQDWDYQGNAWSLGTSGVQQIPAPWQGQVSGIQIPAGLQVEACTAVNGGGTCDTYTTSQPRLAGPANDGYTYFRITNLDGGNPPPPPPGGDCQYTVTNGSAERIAIVEHFGRGIIPEDNFIDPGQTLTYQIQSNEFVPNQNWLEVYAGGGWNSGGELVDQLVGPCGTAFTYAPTPPPPDPDPDPDPEPEPVAIGGTVTDSNGTPEPGVEVDLFGSNEAGDRVDYLRSTTTATDGTFSFDVDAGCYVATFIAPDGRRFDTGQTWNNQALCLDDQPGTANATLTPADQQPARIGDTVTDTTGNGINGIAIDLFTADADGSRGTWLDATATTNDGTYGFDVNPGCYVVTFIAPQDQTFSNGSPWLNRSTCVANGETDDTIDAVLVAEGTTATLGGTVTKNGTGFGPLSVDVFTANADGSRGTYLSTAAAAADGQWQTDVSPGCYALTFIAPDGQSFTNGSRWYTTTTCAQPGDTITDLDADLSP